MRLAPGGGEAPDRGLGLGLAIVRRICLLLGHPLTLTSRPGQGACFGVVLPVAAAPVEEKREPPAPRAGEHGIVGARVLVVDDRPTGARASTALLAGWGCEPATAPDGIQAGARWPRPAHPTSPCPGLGLGGGIDGLATIETLRRQAGWSGAGDGGAR